MEGVGLRELWLEERWQRDGSTFLKGKEWRKWRARARHGGSNFRLQAENGILLLHIKQSSLSGWRLKEVRCEPKC